MHACINIYTQYGIRVGLSMGKSLLECHMRSVLKKSSQWAWFVRHRCNVAAKERTGMHVCEQWWLHCVSGNSRRHWVNVCTVWVHMCMCTFTWLNKQSNRSASDFVFSLNIPLWKLFGWFRRIWGMIQWVQHKHFKDGWESFESDPHSGRPATSRTPENVERVQAVINKDQWLSVQELGADLGIPQTTVSEIF